MVEHFYCQLDYEDVPYLSGMGAADGNVANNGCGVCCSSMLIESMLGISFPPRESAKFCKACGAREGFGTNYYICAGALAGRFSLRMRPTESIDEVVRFLNENKNAKAVANVRGDREGYTGVFSDGGHYVLIDGASGDELRVYDPMYRAGRYDTPGRKGKVRMEGFAAYADKEVLRQDCFERPYFIFWQENA